MDSLRQPLYLRSAIGSLTLIAMLIALLIAGGARAKAPTADEMRAAMQAFDSLKGLEPTGFSVEDGALKTTLSTPNGDMTVMGFVPVGSGTVVLALLRERVPLGKSLEGNLDLPFEDLSLVDVTALLVLPGDFQQDLSEDDLPKAVRDRIRKITKEINPDLGVNLYARVDAKAKGAAADALKAIGLTKLDDITVQATVGAGKVLMLKKTKPWKNPFGLKNVNRQTTSLDGLTLLVSKTGTISPENAIAHMTKAAKNLKNKSKNSGKGKKAGAKGPLNLSKTRLSGWGQLNLNKNKYLFFAQYVTFEKKVVGKAYGLDAEAITLASLADFAAALPMSNALASKGLDKLPLGQFKLENPNYKDHDPESYAPPDFETMIVVAASKGVTLPDKKPLPGTKGLITGTVGPLVYANGEATVFGEHVGNVEARMSVHGLKADAKIKARSIGPIAFDAGLDFHLGPKDDKKAHDHEMKMTGKAAVHGLGEISLSIYADREKVSYHIPASCPLNPSEITATAPSTAGLVLNGIDDFDVTISLNDCYSDAIMGVVKDPKKLVGLTKDLAKESTAVAAATAQGLANAITDADKTWKTAWKTSVDVGQTAVNAVKDIDKTIKSLNTSIKAVAGVIDGLAGEIKKLAKKIGDFFTGKLNKKKREKKAEEAKKKRLEARRKKARQDREKAKEAVGKVAPHLDPGVLAARDARVDLLFKQKLADARKAYAKRLQKEFRNKARRKKLIDKIDSAAIIKAHLPELPSGSLAAMGKAGGDLATLMAERRAEIEKLIVAAAYEKAMEDHLAALEPDPEFEIPFGEEIRLIGQYAMCLEATAQIGGKGIMAVVADYQQHLLRLNHCHNTKQKKVADKLYATQRFKFTNAGKLVALFDKRDACFHGDGRSLRTTKCLDDVKQIFFFDPTIEAVRPLNAKGDKEPRCIGIRGPARAGAEVELKPCDYNKNAKTWRIDAWTKRLPKKEKVPALPSLWVNYGKSYGKAKVHKTGDLVSLSGLIKLTPRDHKGKLKWSETIDVLATKHRPKHRLIFNVNTHVTSSRLDIMPDGRVQFIAGNKAVNWVSLSGITYPTTGEKNLTLASGCEKYPSKAYAEPYYAKVAETVVLGGLMKCRIGKKARDLATLPKDMRPAKRLIFNVNTHDLSARVDVLPSGKVRWITGGGAKHGWVSLNGIAFRLPVKIAIGTKKKPPVCANRPPRDKRARAQWDALCKKGNAPAKKDKSSRVSLKVPKLAKGCKVYGGAYGPPAVTKENGIIRVSGLIKCPFTKKKARAIAVLPSGFRPDKTLIFAVNTDGFSARVNVAADGTVRYITGMHEISPYIKAPKWISLDGIAFADKGSAMALKW